MKKTLFILLQHCLPQHLLSSVAGWLASQEYHWLKNCLIRLFARQFKVNMQEAQIEDLSLYPSFNQFFTRALKPEARPIDNASLCSPADGAISQLGTIDNNELVQAKSKTFHLNDFLANDTSLSQAFKGGEFITIYLSPKDYHRVHMPCDGRLIKTTYVPGKLFSVNQTTTDALDNLFARNERLICEFDTEQGTMAVVLVGAMIVAGIETVWHDYSADKPVKTISVDYPEGITLKKGQELGRFKLGSTVILLLQKNATQWCNSLSPGKPIRMGSRLSAA